MAQYSSRERSGVSAHSLLHEMDHQWFIVVSCELEVGWSAFGLLEDRRRVAAARQD